MRPWTKPRFHRHQTTQSVQQRNGELRLFERRCSGNEKIRHRLGGNIGKSHIRLRICVQDLYRSRKIKKKAHKTVLNGPRLWPSALWEGEDAGEGERERPREAGGGRNLLGGTVYSLVRGEGFAAVSFMSKLIKFCTVNVGVSRTVSKESLMRDRIFRG